MRIRPPAIRRTRRTVRTEPTAAPTPVIAAEHGPNPSAGAPRRSSSRRIVIITLLLVLATSLAAALLLTMPRVDDSDVVRLTRDATPVLELRIEQPARVLAGNVDATIAGRAVPARDVRVLDGGAVVQLRAPRLADGRHDVAVAIADVGVLRRTLHADWTLTVDTTAPEARIAAPAGARNDDNPYARPGVAIVTKLPLAVAIDAEPGSTLRVGSDGAGTQTVEVDASTEQRRSVELDLRQGGQSLVVVATDEAGNVTELRRRVLVDTAGPAIAVRAPRVVKDATLALPFTARDPHGVDLQVRLDGSVQEDVLDVASSTDAPGAVEGSGDGDATDPATTDPAGSADGSAGSEDEDGEGGDVESPLPVALRGTITLDDAAYEGRHALEVVATDALGQRRTLTRTIFVDSTDRLADAAGLRIGARGRDVIELHDALVKAGVATRAQLAADARTRTYAGATRDAVTRFQNQRGMSADGIAGADTIAALTLKIVVDRGAHTITLYRLGEVVKSWGVAVGSAEFPTPAGEFEIVNMQEDPTWTPPDSEWAKDAEVTPPGPDNPLGTRWMGIGGTIGIHGTNSPASIGYSVSHGCIRMTIPDVEELFGMVTIGTPVTVV